MRALNYRVFLRFVGHGIAPNRKYLHIITTAQRLTHRILGIAEQARTHVAVGRQAQAVAARAKWLDMALIKPTVPAAPGKRQ